MSRIIESEDERVIQLISSGVWEQDDGQVVVSVCAIEEPWDVNAGMRLTGDDALALAHELREAAQHVSGSEPQEFIRVRLVDFDG